MSLSSMLVENNQIQICIVEASMLVVKPYNFVIWWMSQMADESQKVERKPQMQHKEK